MDPRVAGVRGSDHRLEVVAGAGVHLAHLGADDRRRVGRPECVLEQFRAHPALVVDGEDVLLRLPMPSSRRARVK